jgi:hypothetical protein
MALLFAAARPRKFCVTVRGSERRDRQNGPLPDRGWRGSGRAAEPRLSHSFDSTTQRATAPHRTYTAMRRDRALDVRVMIEGVRNAIPKVSPKPRSQTTGFLDVKSPFDGHTESVHIPYARQRKETNARRPLSSSQRQAVFWIEAGEDGR